MASKQPILLTDEIIPPPAPIHAGIEALPAVVRARGERASRRFIEFFTASIRNRNTRAAYARAIRQFFDWCERRRLELHDIEAITVAAYIEQLGNRVSKPTVKQLLLAAAGRVPSDAAAVCRHAAENRGAAGADGVARDVGNFKIARRPDAKCRGACANRPRAAWIGASARRNDGTERFVGRRRRVRRHAPPKLASWRAFAL